MNIYLSHSRSFDFTKELYTPIRTSTLNSSHFFLLPHEDSDTVFPTKEYFESQQCDVVIAEVSYPSTGQGIELGWAEMLHIPIICFHKHDAKVSQSLYVVTNKFITYSNSDDLIKKIDQILSNYEQTKN
jgi:nucleoside 2-deoxyribosyltransferase